MTDALRPPTPLRRNSRAVRRGNSAPRDDARMITDRQIIELRLAGATFDQIATRVGMDVASVSRAVDRWSRTYAEETYGLRERLVSQEGGRLDRMQMAVWGAAMNGDVAAVNTVLRIMERRAKMLGLDAPTRVTVDDATDTEIATLLTQLGAPAPIIDGATGQLIE